MPHGGGNHFLAEDRMEDLLRRRRAIGGPAGQGLVEDRAQRVNVHAGADGLGFASDLFRRHVGERPQQRPFLRLGRAVLELGQAEIGDLGLAVGA